MSVFRDLVNIWKSEDNLSQAWSESNDMLHLSHEMFNDAVEALRSGEKNKVLKSIRDEGILDILTESGFKLREPGCSACLAMNDDKIPKGKYAVSTTNRNFEGDKDQARGHF